MAVGLDSFFKASRASWALPSCTMPITALSSTTISTMMASDTSFSSREMAAAANRM